MDIEYKLLKLIAKTKRYRKTALLADGFTWGAVIALALFSGALLASLSGPLTSNWRTFLFIAGLLTILGVVAWRAIWPILRFRGEERVALFLESNHPQLKSQVISSVQLYHTLPELAEKPLYSTTLIRGLIQQTVQSLEAIDLTKGIHRNGAKARCVLLLSGMLIMVLLGLNFPDHFSRAYANLLYAEPSNGAALSPGLLAKWRIGDIELKYIYPAYSGIGMRRISGASGHIAALKGTSVHWRSRAPFPVKSAALVFSKGVMPLEVKGDLLEGIFPVLEPDRYHVRLVNQEGRKGEGLPWRSISVLEDRFPKLELKPSSEKREWSEQDEFDLSYQVSDDFGLAKLQWVTRVLKPGSKERFTTIDDFSGQSIRFSKGKYRVSIAKLAIKPGERLEYFLRIYDNDLVSGPKYTDSDVQALKITSARERHQRLIEAQRRIWNKLIHLLGDRLEQEQRLKGDANEDLERLADIAIVRKTSSLQGEIELELMALRKDPLIREAVLAAFSSLSNRLATQERRDREMLWNSKGLLKGLARNASLAVTELEKDVLTIEDLIHHQALENMRGLADEIMEAQKNLRKMIENYKKTKDPRLREAILREVKRLREKLAELMKRASKLATRISDNFLNLDALKSRNMFNSLRKIEQSMNDGSLDKALKELGALEKRLRDMLTNLETGSKGFYSSRFRKVEKKMNALLDDAHNLERAQRKIADRTAAIRRKTMQRQHQSTRAQLKSMVDKAQKYIKRIDKRLSQVTPELRSRYTRAKADRARQRLKETGLALMQNDYYEARQMCKRASKHTDSLDNFFKARAHALSPVERLRASYVRDQLKPARSDLSSLNRTLAKLTPPKEQLSKAEKNELSKLSAKQRELRKRAEGLQNKVERAGADMPFLRKSSGAKLKDAATEMKRASDELGRHRPEEALPHEWQALEKLKAFKKGIKKALAPSEATPGNKGGNRRQRGRRTTGKVKIPGARDSRAPREFREDLLKAMKRGAPERFKKLLQHYYEELVK